MTSSTLNNFFNPRGVAVIGASRDPNKLGSGVLRHLQTDRYPGALYPVNPGAEAIRGLPAYASILDVPDPLDLAVIAIPARFVPPALEDCGRRGVPGVIIISGGFGELGPEGAALETEIVRIAQQYGVRMIGPNCIGTM
ncbi:MAG: CoA-binding protein, partial [Anaerolineae bacterium]|nr:CoA-binding protein [Anaerolineae bacterium]